MSKTTGRNNTTLATNPNQPARPAKATKSGQILQMLRRKKGACLVEIQTATGWRAHSVRGFLSGTVKKRMGLDITSTKDAHGIRRYHITG